MTCRDAPLKQIARDGAMRIGELAGRVGLSTHTLRAWETRYGLLRPTRTVSGYRLYGPDDERRVRAVLDLRASGVSPAQAAARVLAHDSVRRRDDDARTHGDDADERADFADAMFAAAARFDDAAAEAALDHLLSHTSIVTAIDTEVLPFLAALGQRWQDGSATIAHEHFLSAVLRRRFAPLTVSARRDGPIAVLAAPSDEWHDLPLILFGAALAHAGWQVRQLGADTPIREVESASADAAVVVLAATTPERLTSDAASMRQLGKRLPVAIAGAGASREVARRTHTTRLPDHHGEALRALTQLIKARQ